MAKTGTISVVADLVDSRLVKGRSKLASLIEGTLRELNHDCKADIIAPFVTTRGIDEISAVLITPKPSFDLLVHLNEAIWPQRFRFAVASGAIDVGGGGTDAAAMDGPAFHRAADTLARTKREKIPLGVWIEGMSSETRELIENLAWLHHVIMKDWTPARWRAIRAYRRLGSQKEVAGELDITQQSVSEALKGGHIDALLAAEAAIRGALNTTALDRGS